MTEGRKRFAAPALKSWEDVDLHLKEIGEIDLKIKAIEADMNLKLSDAKLAAEMEAKPLMDRKAKLELEVKDYAESHKHEIEGKTKKLNFGQCGFRLSAKIIISKAKACIEALKAKGMLDCINVKEEINKDVLRTYSDDIIASIGARRKSSDVFWLEPDYEKLKS